MNNYYHLLDIPQESSEIEIKKAFRKKIKQIHPDVAGKACAFNNRVLVQLIKASKILLNSQYRKEYDSALNNSKKYFYISSYNIKSKKIKTFDYEAFLRERKHIFSYKAKMFLYDIVSKEGHEAAKIYVEIKNTGMLNQLRKELGNYDYFDSIFLLAEYYHTNKRKYNINEALSLYVMLGDLEEELYYFKDYMNEVAERILYILNKNDVKNTQYILLKMTNWNLSCSNKKRVKNQQKTAKNRKKLLQ